MTSQGDPSLDFKVKQQQNLASKTRSLARMKKDFRDLGLVYSRMGLHLGSWPLKSCAKSTLATSVERRKVGLKIHEKELKHFREGRAQEPETKRGR